METEFRTPIKSMVVSKFTWMINNFSQLDGRLFASARFIVNRERWRVVINPKGINNSHLSIYLRATGSSRFPNGWSIPANFCIALINQINGNKTIEKVTSQTFNDRHRVRGFPYFIPLDDLFDKSRGYLVEDMCVIEVEVHVPDNVSKDLDSSVRALYHVESVYTKARSFMESLLPKKPSSLPNHALTCEVPLLKPNATFVQEFLDMLIISPLVNLANSESEAAIMKSLSLLNENLFSFSDIQAKEIMNLKASFPLVVQEWRDSSENPWCTLEKAKTLLEDLLKTEEGIKTELEELNKKEMELEAQLETIESKRLKLEEGREGQSKHTEKICSIAKEYARKVEAKEVEVDRANNKVELSLKSKWSATRQLFA